jgi:anti-anti-sigma factor
MDIKEERAGDVLVLAPAGDLTSGEDCHALEQRLSAIVVAGNRFLVVDCEHVSHLKSPAVRALLVTSRKVMRARGRLVLCGMTPKVHKAFSISGLDREFSVVSGRDEALRLVLEPLGAKGGAKRPVPAEQVPAAAPPELVDAPAPPATSAPAPAVAAAPPPSASAPPPAAAPAPDPLAALGERLAAALSGGAAEPAPSPPPMLARDLDRLADALVNALDARPA